MEKFWKTVAIGSILLLILAAGIGIVMAQDDGTATPPVETDPADEGEDDAWGPRGWFGYGRGMMGQWDDSRPLPESVPFGHHGMFGSSSSLLDILAEQLGLTVDEVVDELSAGITIADLAANHNVDVQVIVDAFLAAHQEALSAAVEDGRLTQEQADAMQDHMAEEIAERVNQPWTGSYGPRGGFRGGCGGGMGGRWNSGSTSGGAAPMRGLSTGSSL